MPTVSRSSFRKTGRIIAAGIKCHTTILHSGWVGVDTYDYTLTDKTLDALLKDNRDILYMPRVKLNVPPMWCAAHPEDTFVYSNGLRTAEEIRALVGGTRHDWFGADMKGYPVNGGQNGSFADHENFHGLIGLQSFSSKQWIKDASKALSRLIDHIMNDTPYGSQIIGFHIAYGCCGETTQWGSWIHGKPERHGDPGGEQGPAMSVSRQKVWLDEIDNFTHLDRRASGLVCDFAETRSILWREATKNLSRDQGFWWMDLGEGSFDAPDVMQEIRAITDFAATLNEKPWRSESEILLVQDNVSLCKTPLSYGLNAGLLRELPAEMQLIGAPVDTLRTSDLLDCDLSRYRLVVFGHTFYFEKGQWESIRARLRPDATLVFHHAPGALSPDFSLDHVQEITGMRVRELPWQWEVDGDYGYSFGYQSGRVKNYEYMQQDFPALEILPQEGVQVMATYPTEQIMTARCKKTVLCAYPSLRTPDLRALAEEAGCHMYAPVGCVVQGDNRFVSVFNKQAIVFTLMLDGHTAAGKKELPITLGEGGMTVLMYDQA